MLCVRTKDDAFLLLLVDFSVYLLVSGQLVETEDWKHYFAIALNLSEEMDADGVVADE